MCKRLKRATPIGMPSMPTIASGPIVYVRRVVANSIPFQRQLIIGSFTTSNLKVPCAHLTAAVNAGGHSIENLNHESHYMALLFHHQSCPTTLNPKSLTLNSRP